MNWTACLFGSPFHLVSGVLVVLDLALAVYYAVKLSFIKHSEQLPGMEHGINIMLPASFGILFFTLLKDLVALIRISFSIAKAGTGDPRVILAGLIQWMIPFTFYGTFCLFFLIVWYFLRTAHRLRINQLK